MAWPQGRIVAFLVGVALFLPTKLVGLLFLKIPVVLRLTAYEGGSATHLGLGPTDRH